MTADLPEELAAKREALLEHATVRGMRLRVRRRALVGMAVVVAVAATGAGLATALAGDGHAARIETSPGTTGAAETTTTGAPVGPSTGPSTPATAESPTSVAPATVGTEPATDTTILVCHDSYDPRCGPLSFTSTPVNQPLLLQVDPTVSGRTVTLHVRASDDAAIAPCMSGSWGDGQFMTGPFNLGCMAAGLCPRFRERYGPWDPPAPTPSTVTLDLTHTYAGAGRFTIDLDAVSGVPCSPDQYYASSTPAQLEVTIPPAPTTTEAPATTTTT